MDRLSFNKAFGKYIEQDMLLPEEIQMLENWFIEKPGYASRNIKQAVIDNFDNGKLYFRTQKSIVRIYPGRRIEIEAKILLGLDPQLPDY